MRTGAETLAHFVCDATHVSSRGYACAKACAAALHREDDEFFDLNLYRIEHNVLLSARQLVGWDAIDLLSGERGRHLLDEAEELGGEFLKIIESGADCV